MPGAKPGGRRPPYPLEMRERAVRMLFDHAHEYPSQWAAISSISTQLGVNHETLRQWVRRAETDAGQQSWSETLTEGHRPTTPSAPFETR